MIPVGELAAWTPDAIKSLYWDGIIRLPWSLPSDNVSSFADHLREQPVYQGHVIAHGDGNPIAFEHSKHLETVSYRMESVLSAPAFLEFALQFTDLAEAYLGSFPRLYSFNAFWTRPGPSEPNVHIQQWHRDRDDRRFLVLFLYGTDVLTDEQGPHLLAKGTHRTPDDGNRPPRWGEPVERVYGAAGTMFLADASALHMGIKPQSGERLLAWARWGVSNPPRSYGWDKLEPVPVSTIRPEGIWRWHNEKESTRLIIDWNR